MNAVRKRRLMLLGLMVLGIGSAVAVALYALKQNINLFFTPSDIIAGKAPHGHSFRLGGMVEKGSVKRDGKTLDVSFRLTDYHQAVSVKFRGILPDLFREGQGIVTEGVWLTPGYFKAKQVLAKHDSNYMPKDVKDALEKQRGEKHAA